MNKDEYAAVQCQGDSVPGQPRCGQVKINHDEYFRQLIDSIISDRNSGELCHEFKDFISLLLEAEVDDNDGN